MYIENYKNKVDKADDIIFYNIKDVKKPKQIE